MKEIFLEERERERKVTKPGELMGRMENNELMMKEHISFISRRSVNYRQKICHFKKCKKLYHFELRNFLQLLAYPIKRKQKVNFGKFESKRNIFNKN